MDDSVASKQSTVERYRKAVSRAIVYIDSQIDGKPRLKDIAGEVGMSQFHFHRVFHAFTGETVNAYVARLKLERSANLLVCSPDLSIAQVAELLGFSSPANFSKAFKAHFGISPSQLRSPKPGAESQVGNLIEKYSMKFEPSGVRADFDQLMESEDAENYLAAIESVQILELDETPLVALQSPRGYDADAIIETWSAITGLGTSHGIEVNAQSLFGIAHDSPLVTPLDRCRYEACISLGSGVNVKAPFHRTRLPGGEYAVFNYSGSAAGLVEFVNYLYTIWLPTNDLMPGHPPVVHHLGGPPGEGTLRARFLIKLLSLD